MVRNVYIIPPTYVQYNVMLLFKEYPLFVLDTSSRKSMIKNVNKQNSPHHQYQNPWQTLMFLESVVQLKGRTNLSKYFQCVIHSDTVLNN